MRITNPLLLGAALGLSGLLMAASPAPQYAFSLETSLRDMTSGEVFAQESYSAQSKVLDNSYTLAREIYEDLSALGGCEYDSCEIPGPIKQRWPRICGGVRSHGELVDHGPVRENVNLIENNYTESLREVLLPGPIEGGPMKFRGGPPDSVINMICFGGQLDRLHNPDVNANVQAGTSCIEHGGSPDAKVLRIDDSGYQFVDAGTCTDN